MGDGFTYYAFVSYSHKDQKWAEWIQNAIEHYKLPAIIRKEAQKQLPKRIAPVFRDATDLGVDVLVDGLHEELERSRFLIVVCSPNSAKPNAEGKHFVDEEVRHFCELGRTKQVIPVIVEGTPEESFGPVLKSKDIKALDATKSPKDRILNDIVAKILGLKPDALWRRWDRERRKRLIIRSILCGILGFFVAVAGYFAWDANRTVKNYYADYVDSFGLPEGIFPLKELDLTHRHIHYRFEYRGFQYGKSPHADSADWCVWNMFGFRRRLVRVVQANSRGYPIDRKNNDWGSSIKTEYDDRPPIQDFMYDADLRLREIRCGQYNGYGRLRLVKRMEFFNESFETNGLVKFFKGKGQLEMSYGNAHSTLIVTDGELSIGKSRSAVTQNMVHRDKHGRAVQILFLDVEGGNISDADGICGFSFEHDHLGRQTVKWYLVMQQGGVSRGINKTGEAGLKYNYEGRNIKNILYIDQNGTRIMAQGLVSGCRYLYDTFDNKTEEWYLDDNEELCCSHIGHVGCRAKYDNFGRLKRITYFESDGRSVKSVLSKVMEYDEHGNVCKKKLLGSEDKPQYVDGYTEHTYEYDVHGRMVRDSFKDENGQPALRDSDGISAVDCGYDEQDNIIFQRYLGVDGKPTTSRKYGYSEMRLKYNKKGKPVEEAYFDPYGKLALYEGVAKVVMRYDKRGNKKETVYFGIDDKEVESKNGYARVEMKYNEQGKVVNMRYFNAVGREVFPKEVAITFDIISNSEADKNGSKKEDIWCRLGSYEFVENIDNLAVAIQSTRDIGKELLVARKLEDGYKIISLKFPVGRMGIRVVDSIINDFDKLEKAYRAYCEKEKGELK